MDAPPPPPPPRRRSRGAKKLLALGLVGTASLAWFAPLIVAKTSLKNAVIRAATAKLNGTVTVGRLSLSWFSPVEITDLTVTDVAGREVLTAPTVHTSKTLLALALDRSDLGTVTVTKPTLTVVSADRTNVEELLDEYLRQESTGRRPAVTLEIVDGRVLIADRANPPAPVLERAAASVAVSADPTGPVTVSATADGPDPASPGQVDVKATLGPDSTARLRALGFPVAGFAPLVERVSPGTRVGGRLTADLTATAGATTGVTGRADLAGFDVQSPLLGPDRVKLALARVVIPKGVTLQGDTITVGPGTELDCDVGKLVVAGAFSPSDTPEQMLARHGLSATADLDLARLAAVAPKLLHIRPGVELSAGRVKAEVASVASERGVGWKGKVETDALKGTRDGQAVGWDHPFRAVFDAHLRPNGLPEFDDLQCQSEFVGLHARGTVDQFVARANLDLDKLAAHLGQFVDLGGAALAGNGSCDIDLRPADGGKNKLTVVAQLTRFKFTSGGLTLNEPALSATAQAVGRFHPTGPVPVDSLSAEVSAHADKLTVNLVEPVADLRAAGGGTVAVKLTGDLGRWAGRAAPVVGLPAGLEIGGNAAAAGTFAVTTDAVRCQKLVADVQPFRFRGFGLNLDEQRAVHAESGLAVNVATGAVALTGVRFDSDTARVAAERIDLSALSDGGLGVKGKASLTANISRVRQAINFPVELGGVVKNTFVNFDIGAGGVVKFDADVTGENVTLGPPQNPAWTEPRAKLLAAGTWDPKADDVRFDRLRAERDGLVADARGALTKMSTPAAAVAVNGTLAYDLSKLEPQLRQYLGKDVRAVGKETRPFQLSGPLGDGGRNVAVAVGKPAGPFDRLAGSAGLGWQELFAYGFEVGRADLSASLDRGVVRFTPVKATFGGGTIELAPTVRLDPDYTLTLAPGRVVSKATLTPAACANAVGFVLPPLANAAEVTGLVSLDLGENRIPLIDPNRMAVDGTLTVHKATLSPGPLFREITAAMETPPVPLTLTQEQAVPFRVENGRVYHKQFRVMIEKTEVRTSGSVGLDGTLNLLVEVQVPPRLAQQLFPNNPIARESLARQTMRFPVGGTLDKPRLEPGAVRAAVRGVAGEAARDGLGEFLRRGADKLIQDMEKKNPPEKK